MRKLNTNPIDTSLRPVPGGFVRRVNMGDRWEWQAFGFPGVPYKFAIYRTKREAMERVRKEAEERHEKL